MNEKALHTLEYDKILLRLEALAGSEGAKTLCRDLRPMTDPEKIRKEFDISKAAFKRAVGHLLKENLAEIKDGKIYLK